MRISFSPELRIALLLFASAAIYWPGLHGPFLFDDFWNLAPVEYWYLGKQDWRLAVFPSDSFIASRPIAMASFMASLSLGGEGPFPMKLGNLLLHLLCGVLVWRLSLRLFTLDVQLRTHAGLLAFLACAVWMLHPLHVSTVLYVVQRMAQISTLFTILAILAYLQGRASLSSGATHRACAWLFVAFPLFLVLGVLGKQNAATAGLLCCVIEFCYMTRRKHERPFVAVFLGLFALLPVVAAASVLITRPSSVFGAYQDLDFNVAQRLLTQPAVILDYLKSWLVPYTPSMGLYTDDFPVAENLLSPPTTILAIAAIASITLLAWRMKRLSAGIAAGWMFFLLAHSVEASFLPLEMHYEHRNYLPSVGLLISLMSLLFVTYTRLQTRVQHLNSISYLLAIGFLLVLSAGTLGRVLVWQHKESIMLQGVTHHPDSMRAVFEYSSLLMGKGEFEEARDVLRRSENSKVPRLRQLSKLNLIALNCLNQSGSNRRQMMAAVAEGSAVLTVYEVQLARFFTRINQGYACGSLDAGAMADGFLFLLSQAHSQPESSPNKAAVRSATSQLLARASRWTEAQEQALLAWNGVGDGATAALLVRYYAAADNRIEAERILNELRQRVLPSDRLAQAEIARLESLLSSRKQ